MEQTIQEFFTWNVLGTMAGATAATMVFTQLLKGIAIFDKLPTRIFSYLVALVVLVAANVFMGQVTVGGIALCAINAAVVALAAQGGFEMISSGVSTKKIKK